MANFYRIKTEWVSEKEDKSLSKVKTEELVYAENYTDAESVACELIRKYDRTRFGSVNYEIVKTKISELLYNHILQTDTAQIANRVTSFFEEGDNSGVGMYQVKVYYTEIDPKSAREKHSTETIFTPANSNYDATQYVLDHLKNVGETRDYIVRDTKYDKAEAILWPYEFYMSKVSRTM